MARASAANLPFPPSQFDLVTSFDVLYALEDEMEREALNEMYRVLRPGGQILINVAAMKMLTGNHSVLGGEIRRYSRQELRAHVERAGFEVRRITYTNFLLLPLVLFVRFAQRLAAITSPTTRSPCRAPPVNAILAGTLALEAQALKRSTCRPAARCWRSRKSRRRAELTAAVSLRRCALPTQSHISKPLALSAW